MSYAKTAYYDWFYFASGDGEACSTNRRRELACPPLLAAPLLLVFGGR